MSSRYSIYGMAGVGIAAAIGFVFALTSVGNNLVPSNPLDGFDERVFTPGVTGPSVLTLASTQTLKKFASVNELKAFLLNVETNRVALSQQEFAGYAGEALRGAPLLAPMPLLSLEDAQTASDAKVQLNDQGSSYSATNVQVAGVDEPDFLKNDGKYVYILSGDRLTIVDAYPAEDASIAIKVGLDIQQGQYLQNMFLNNSTLVIFYLEYGEEYVIQEYEFAPQPVYSPKTHALVMDVSDPEKPKVVKNYEVSGSYNNARMIGDQVYLITTSDLYNYRQPVVPRVMESSKTVVMPEIFYFDNPELYYSFNTLTSIDITGEGAVNSKTFMMNPASTLYVSEDNIYITYMKNLPYYYYGAPTKERFFDVVVSLLPQDVQQQIKSVEAEQTLSPSEKWDQVSELLQDAYNRMSEQDKNQLFETIHKALAEYDARIQRETQMTVIHKIAIGGSGIIEYGVRGEVPGRLLNQFSMDEHEGKFRVATTSEYYSPYSGSKMFNNVYVLNENLEAVGKLEEIAPDESIYAARFMGDRLYLVTFQRIDPFFVIDLSSDQPKVLGALKLPGFSNYLHPYDENHIIGIGKETKENQYGGVEILGVKVALFDVSNVANPSVVDVFEIGGRGTDSEVLVDHKALLFDRGKNVLSIPVSIYPDYGDPRPLEEGMPVQPKIWRGFYVFGIDPASGIDLKGKVEHLNDVNDYYYGYGVQGSRSFYIDDVLYTVTLNNLIKMNSLQDLSEINQLSLGSTGGIVPYPTLEKSEAQ